MTELTVTVGLCVKNAAHLVKNALDSLCRQTYPAQNMELIVVDGASSDNTLNVIQSNLKAPFGRVQIYSESSGLGIARQMVVEYASGKYIVWLDADMTFASDYLQNQVAFMDKHPEVGIASGKYTIHVGYGLAADLENIVYVVDSVYGQRGNASKYGYLPGAEGSVYRVSAVREVGGFDTSIKGAGEDTDAAYRIRDKGWDIAYTNETFTEYTRSNWQSLWREYVWYGKGAHYLHHKDPDAINILRMTPMAGFVAGVLRSPGAYLLTHKKSFMLLPLHYTYKRFAWLVGFVGAHVKGYGHKQ